MVKNLNGQFVSCFNCSKLNSEIQTLKKWKTQNSTSLSKARGFFLNFVVFSESLIFNRSKTFSFQRPWVTNYFNPLGPPDFQTFLQPWKAMELKTIIIIAVCERPKLLEFGNKIKLLCCPHRLYFTVWIIEFEAVLSDFGEISLTFVTMHQS